MVFSASRFFIAACATLMLAGCASTQDQTASSGGMWGTVGNLFSSPQPQAPAPAGPDQVTIVCPKVEVQPGTAAYKLTEGNPSDPFSVRYQASLGELVRECVNLGAEVSLRVGISGRVMVGPKGKSGTTLTVPLRIVVLDENDKPVFSRLVPLKVSIAANETGVNFTHVEGTNSMPIPANNLRGWKIRVGFDTKAR